MPDNNGLPRDGETIEYSEALPLSRTWERGITVELLDVLGGLSAGEFDNPEQAVFRLQQAVEDLAVLYSTRSPIHPQHAIKRPDKDVLMCIGQHALAIDLLARMLEPGQSDQDALIRAAFVSAIERYEQMPPSELDHLTHRLISLLQSAQAGTIGRGMGEPVRGEA